MDKFLFDLSVVLVATALLAIIAVRFHQPIIIAYIACGIIIGPWGAGLVKTPDFIETISRIGITLLLFLAGLCLHPQRLIELFRKTTIVTLVSCFATFIIASFFSFLMNFTLLESLIIGLALMFSSTILTVKLLPTTKLHQQRMGALCISILIAQDLLAIAVMALIQTLGIGQNTFFEFVVLIVKLSVFIVMLLLFERFVLRRFMMQVERFHELLFLLGLAWCFGIAGISNKMGLFYETGAFFAGVAIAQHRVSLFISERLKPLRDFFLVLFFFTLGAKLDLVVLKDIFIPAVMLSAIFIFIKPWLFKHLFLYIGEKYDFARETGMRLGQLSEFSLLIALLGYSLGHIGSTASQFIQVVTIFTFIASSYLVVLRFPTPIGTSEDLIRD